MNEETVSTIILSGGLGRRFGQQDKGLINWQGKPLIEHVIERLRDHSSQILISCNRNLDDYEKLGYPLYIDREQNYLGPLAGVMSAAPAVTSQYCLLCPNDTPLLPDNLIEILQRTLSNHPYQVAYPYCGNRNHYLPALIRSDILPSVTDYLQRGGRSLHGWYEEFASCAVDFSAQAACFANINTPAALAELE